MHIIILWKFWKLVLFQGVEDHPPKFYAKGSD